MAVGVGLSQGRTRLVARLRARKSRAREERVLVEGVRAVREALEAGIRPEFAVTSPRLAATPDGEELARRLADAGPIEVTDGELDALSDTEHAQGVLMVCREPRCAVADLPLDAPLLIADAVQDPGNLGSLIRSAVAFGFGGVACLDGTVDPWSPKVVRASAGTVLRIPVAGAAAAKAIGELSARGVRFLVASVEGVPLSKTPGRSDGGLPFSAGWALVVGNEGAGVRQGLRSAAHATVAVPMRGPAESLNVGIAGAILMYEMTRSTS